MVEISNLLFDKESHLPSLRQPVAGNNSLCFRFEALDACFPQACMFRFAALHPGSPFLPVFEAKLLLHQTDDFLLAHTKLGGDGFKRGTVFPGHADNPINVIGTKIILLNDIHWGETKKCIRGLEESFFWQK